VGGTTDAAAFVPFGMNAVLFSQRKKEKLCSWQLFFIHLEETYDYRFLIYDFGFESDDFDSLIQKRR